MICLKVTYIIHYTYPLNHYQYQAMDKSKLLFGVHKNKCP